MNKQFFLFFLIFIVRGTLLAQDTFERDYANGKDLFNLGKYELSMEAFRSLTRKQEGNKYAEHASFYYAMAAYKANLPSLAKSMFLQIQDRFPHWPKIDEVNFWLGKLSFEEGKSINGMDHLSMINLTSIKKDAKLLKKIILDSLQDLGTLSQLYMKYPQDDLIAATYAREVMNAPVTPENRALLRELIQKHNLDKSSLDIVDAETSLKKESYDVAILFPFKLDDISIRRLARSNFVTDLYQGILLAQEQLKNLEISLNIYAYDTKRDSAATAEILQMEELKTMDLIVGPLYPMSSKLVSEWSEVNKINMINPISDNAQVIGNNPYSFLYKSSNITKALAAANLARHAFANKNAVIIYSSSPKDSVTAYTYKQAIEKDSFKVVWMHRSLPKESKVIPKVLAETIEDSYTLIIKCDSIGHIFVASERELIAANTITAVESRGDKIPIIGHSSWIDFRFIEYEQLDRLDVLMVAPNYIDRSRDEFIEFKQTYINQYHRVPTKYLYWGYDMLMFAGRMMDQYGIYFQHAFPDMEVHPGELSLGFQYNYSNDNQHLEIIRFEGSDLTYVDPTLIIESFPCLEEIEEEETELLDGKE